MHEHIKIRLTTRGKIVFGILVTLFVAGALYIFSWVLNDYPEPALQENTVECVVDTYLSYEGTCEPEKVEL